jgi:5-(carboxyamino)imidazole ribonucleotide mutase
MPPGVPVAAVAVSGAKNAGHLAARILALCDHDLAVKVDAHRRQLEAEVLEKDERLREMGLDAYLEERSRD